MRIMAMCAAVVALVAVPAVPARAQPADGLSVMLAQRQASVAVGARVTVTARIDNRATGPSAGLVAHLSVVTLDPAVYVDLEDWTTSPTRPLAPLPPRGSTTATWEIQAVNAGRFSVYVAVLPNGAAAGPGQALSEPELVAVAGRRAVNAGGVLPVAVAAPVLLGLVALGALVRRRRAG
jgi:hypothetical protein